MGKRAELAKKRRRLQSSIEQKFAITATGDIDQDAIPPEDLEITLSVLSTLSTRPALLASPLLRDLKKSIRSVNHLMADASGDSLTARISHALQDCRFDDAFVLLFEMYGKHIPPKLGALQRWVRECDAVATMDTNRDTNDAEEGFLEDQRDEDAMRCLDLMLRIVNPEMDKKGKQKAEKVIRGDVWSARGNVDGEIDIWRKVQDGSIPSCSSGSYPGFRVVAHTPGHLRRPPNRYASTVYASLPSTISLTPASSRPPTQKVDVPGVPGAFMVLDVFTPGECEQIVKAAMGIGMEKDEAVQGSARFKSSILARNLVWLADRDVLDHFYQGLLPYVPQNAPLSDKGEGGGRVRGINARFRVYEYRPNQTYRPHIDGAWPAAGLDPVTGEYLHDSSPPDDPLWSRYTLLVYLNSDIPTGTGSTTFFLPSSTLGVMESVAVRPIQGAVLCFPHGDTVGSLLHEGSAVEPGGGKFVIRTDLLYEARGFGAFKPSALAPASVGENKGGKGEEGIGG